MKTLVLIFFLLSLFSFASTSTPSLKLWPQLKPQGSYEIREGSLLSQNWKVATINFDVINGRNPEGEGDKTEDEEENELYFPLVVPCFECVQKDDFLPNEEGEACVCNFASKDEKICGTAPKGCPKSTCPSSEVRERCAHGGVPSWTELRVSESNVTTVEGLNMSLNQVSYFRFQSSNRCHGYKVKVHYTSGLVDLLISRNYNEPDELHQEWSTSSRQYPDLTEVDLCPGFINYGLGTFYITVIARTDMAVFDLSIYSQEATIDEPKEEEEILCKEGVECIYPGRPLTFNNTNSVVNTLSKFRFTFKARKFECKTITVYLQADNGDAGISGDFENEDVNYFTGSPQFQSEYPGSDIRHIQRCFEKDETINYYIVLYQWSLGSFKLRVSLNKTPFLIPTSKLSPYQYAFTATRTLSAKCPGVSAEITWTCEDWKSYCRQFWLTYPAKDPHPFWPTPGAWKATISPVSAAMFSSLVAFDTPLENKRPGSLSLVMLLSNTIFGKEANYLTEEELNQCVFRSSYNARNKHGYALHGTSQVVLKKKECNSKELEPIIEQGRFYLDQMREEKSFNRLLQLAFQVNSLMFSSPWISCQNQANQLLNSTRTLSTTLTTACLVTDQSSSEYLQDPCCNPTLPSCCNPRPQVIPIQQFDRVDDETIEDSCSSPECVSSYASDLMIQNNNQIQCASFSSDQYPSLVEQSQQFYTDCKTKYHIDAITLGEVTCNSEVDCSFSGLQTPCNPITNRCVLTKKIEEATVRCIIEGMDLYTKHYFMERLNITKTKEDGEAFVSSFLSAVSSKECRNDFGHQSHMRNSKVFAVIDPKCSDSNGCDTDSCLDTTCEISPTSCLVYCQMNWLNIETERTTCEKATKCNWMYNACTSDDCEDQCKPSQTNEFFCGYCEDDAHCVELLLTEDICKEMEACLLPDGKLEFLSKKECEDRQSCSQPCHDGLSCQSSLGLESICFSQLLEESCFPGYWNQDLQLCVHPLLSRKLCELSGFFFATCGDLSLQECGDCYNDHSCPPAQKPLQCKVVPTLPCSSKNECENQGGTCDDSLFYKVFGTETDDFGACISPITQSGWAGVFPYCQDAPSLTPQGCVIHTYQSEEDCKDFYYHLASSEEECLASRGCKAYNQMRVLSAQTQEECKNCGKETASYYRWTSANWVTGRPVKLSWRRREVVPLFQWESTINFPQIQSILLDSIGDTLLSDLRSQSLCDFNARSEILNVVACSCTNLSDRNECFSRSLSAVESGSGRACVGLGSTIQDVAALIQVPEDAVLDNAEQRCTTISLYTVSYLTLEQPKRLAFSPLTRVRDYDGYNIVLNDDDAIVGRAMSAGVLLELDGELESYEVCLQPSKDAEDPPKQFEFYDLGVPRNDNSEFLRPLGLSSQDDIPNHHRTFNNSQDKYCFKVHQPQRKQTYFLIAREHNWKNDNGSLYGSEAIAWWIFAALYVVLAIFCIPAILLYFFGYKIHFYFVGLFGFLVVMCVIRGIYFFLLASRVFDDTESWVVYFLIEFPTLLYVSSFSCLAAFWVHLYVNLIKGAGSRLIHVFCLLFNLLLYILFILLLILYNTLPDDTSKSKCPNRVPNEADNSTQQILSIFYQSFMAGASLFLSAIVLVFGLKLFVSLKKLKLEGKMAVMTLICATGLLLHCSLILYLSVRLRYDFVITVVMIILSELIPITTITLHFYSYLRNAVHKKQQRKKGNHTQSKLQVTSSGSSSIRNSSSPTSLAHSSSD